MRILTREERAKYLAELPIESKRTPWVVRCFEETIVDLERQLAVLQEKNDELEQLFDMQHQREIEAILRWRAEAPDGRPLTLPDSGRLLDWLKAQLDETTLALQLTEPVQQRLTAQLAVLADVAQRLAAWAENDDGMDVVIEDIIPLAQAALTPDLVALAGDYRDAMQVRERATRSAEYLAQALEHEMLNGEVSAWWLEVARFLNGKEPSAPIGLSA